MNIDPQATSQLIGVLQGVELGPKLKQQALMFDRIAVLHLQRQIEIMKSDYWWYYRKVSPPSWELEWLLENGVIFEPTFTESSGELLHADPAYQLYNRAYWLMKDSVQRGRQKVTSGKTGFVPIPASGETDINRTLEANFASQSIQVRCASMRLQLSMDCESVPISSGGNWLNSLLDGDDSVVHVVVKSFPHPQEDTAWQDILEFRKDPDSIKKYRTLRRWMRNIGKQSLPAKELREELQYLIQDYEDHMALHRLKVNQGTLETIVTVGAELLEDLVKLKLGAIAKLLFTSKNRKIALLEAERTAPGKEIAYIIKARQTF